ncbi:AlpA family phage regulatory protein [Pseudomonas kermanshahensis]|uniref:AlpA family phage regulatory protein n=1 Tax=Pseudomonas kermanshahensis TaxID=2745482 RepID=A0ABU8R232_9PSED
MSQTATNTTPCVFLFESEVLQILGMGKTALRDWCCTGYFPAPLALGRIRASGRPAKVAWVREEVEAWIEARKAERLTYSRQYAQSQSSQQPA